MWRALVVHLKAARLYQRSLDHRSLALARYNRPDTNLPQAARPGSDMTPILARLGKVDDIFRLSGVPMEHTQTTAFLTQLHTFVEGINYVPSDKVLEGPYYAIFAKCTIIHHSRILRLTGEDAEHSLVALVIGMLLEVPYPPFDRSSPRTGSDCEGGGSGSSRDSSGRKRVPVSDIEGDGSDTKRARQEKGGETGGHGLDVLKSGSARAIGAADTGPHGPHGQLAPRERVGRGPASSPGDRNIQTIRETRLRKAHDGAQDISAPGTPPAQACITLTSCTTVFNFYPALRAAGVRHGDVAARNVVVTRTGELCLVDFGEATLNHVRGGPAWCTELAHF
ncbi:hypothetical protein C8J57DRAFT_1469660 [Mycena rebaudengoi]|nr:hypothetical protein C8J57DRAFT_1469660 [Mycena rebaudengoi]